MRENIRVAFKDYDSGKFIGTLSVDCPVYVVDIRKNEFLRGFEERNQPYAKGKSGLRKLCKYLNNHNCKCKVLKRMIYTEGMSSL